MNIHQLTRTAALVAALAGSMFAQKAVFSENFESGKIDPAVFQTETNGGATIAVEPADGAHGKFALHVHYPDAGKGYAFIVDSHLPDSVSSHFFGRAYMMISSGFAAGATHNPLLFAGDGDWPNSKFFEVGTHKIWMPSFQENRSKTKADGRGEKTYHADTEPPYDKWFLLEWEFSDNPSYINMWVDGKPVMTTLPAPGPDGKAAPDAKPVSTVTFDWPTGSGKNTNISGGFKELGIGTRVWGSTPKAFDVYYDDVAIGTERLGPAK